METQKKTTEKTTNFDINQFKKDINKEGIDLNWNWEEIFWVLVENDVKKIEHFFDIYNLWIYKDISEDLKILQINLLWKLAYQDTDWFLEELKKLFSLWEKDNDIKKIIFTLLPQRFQEFKEVNQTFISNFYTQIVEIIWNLNLIKNQFINIINNINQDNWIVDKTEFNESISNIKLLLIDENISKWLTKDIKKNINNFILELQKNINNKDFHFEKIENSVNNFEKIFDFYRFINDILTKKII